MGSPLDRAAVLAGILEELRLGFRVDENYRQLYDLLHRPLIHFFIKRGCTREDALDLTQETFLGIYKSIGTFRAEGSFEGWIFRIATNIFRKRLRHQAAQKRGREVELEPHVDQTSDQSAGPARILLGKERTTLLAREVERLPPKMRGCLVLRLYHQRKYREIAEILHISIDAVKVHLFQARKRLRDALEQHLEQDTP